MVMAKLTRLDKQWRELMFLCDREKTFRDQGNHPRLLKLVTGHIEHLAREMGFTHRQIQTRDFRAVRNGDHIVSVVRDK